MTPAGNLAALFTSKWRPTEETAAADFSRELDELRTAEFRGARQAMAREIVARTAAACADLAGITPEFQPPPFRALGAWSTMTPEQIELLSNGLKEQNGTTIQTYHCSLCGGEFKTPAQAAWHECPTAREIEGRRHHEPAEPATNINASQRKPHDAEPV